MRNCPIINISQLNYSKCQTISMKFVKEICGITSQNNENCQEMPKIMFYSGHPSVGIFVVLILFEYYYLSPNPVKIHL